MNNIFLFYGEDSFSLQEKLRFWKRSFIDKYDENNLEIIDGKSVKPSELETLLEVMPFLSDKRLVIVRNFLKDQKSEAQKKIATFLPKLADFCILIFEESETPDKRSSLYKKIDQIGQIEHFPILSLNALTKKVLQKAEKLGLRLSFQTAEYLCTHCGLNLWQINNELEKLQLFAEQQTITPELINQLVTPSLSSSIFKLTDAVAGKQALEAIKTFHILLDSGEDIVRAFFMIVRHFRLMIQIKDMLEKNEPNHSIVGKLKQHPFVVQNISRQSQNFSFKRLEELYRNMLTIDRKVKTGLIRVSSSNSKEMNLEIEKLIIDCCTPAM